MREIVAGVGGDPGEYDGWDHVCVAGDEQPSEMGARALEDALDHAGISASSVQLVIAAGVSRDYLPSWSMAAEIMKLYGMPSSCVGVDMTIGCLGMLMAMPLALGWLGGRGGGYAAIVCAEKWSHTINRRDAADSPLWGHADGAGALIVAHGMAAGSAARFLGLETSSYSEFNGLVLIPYGGTRQPLAPPGVSQTTRTLRSVPKSELWRVYEAEYTRVIASVTARYQLAPRLLVCNQISPRIVSLLRDRAGVSEDRVLRTGQRYGHVGSADLAIGLRELLSEHRLDGPVLVAGSTPYAFAAGLVVPPEPRGDEVAPDAVAAELDSLPLADDIERCFEGGWSDGLPVVPPYRTLVDRMSEAMGWESPTQIVGEIADLGVSVRAEQLGAAAVMAGCKLEYAPILRALSDALLDPRFNLSGVEVTTGGAAVLVIASGPIVAELGFAHEGNSLGANARPNATIGRFAGMVRHFCGSSGGALQQFGTVGHPGRLSFCIAEHPRTVWPPFHTQLGLSADDSAVTIMAAEGPSSVNNHYGPTGTTILECIADCIGQLGSTNYYWRGGGYVVVLPPEHLELVAAQYTRETARRWLYERSRKPTDELTRVGRLPPEPRPDANVEPGTPRAPMDTEDQITFIESGSGGGKFSAVIPGWVGNRTVIRNIRRTSP